MKIVKSTEHVCEIKVSITNFPVDREKFVSTNLREGKSASM